MDCIQCGEVFFGHNVKFCSLKCYKEYLKESEKDSDEKNDSSNSNS